MAVSSFALHPSYIKLGREAATFKFHDFRDDPRKELHARDFLAGRGNLGPNTVGKYQRVQIARSLLRILAGLASSGVYSISVAIENRRGQNAYDKAVDRMLNRIQRTLQEKDRRGVLVFDQGKEPLTVRMTRKARVYNPIPSRFGQWSSGSYTRNIVTDRILADPFFRDSAQDYLVQAVDFVAYTLLKQEEPPTPRVLTYVLQEMFPLLEPILYKQASGSDPKGMGIVRG